MRATSHRRICRLAASLLVAASVCIPRTETAAATAAGPGPFANVRVTPAGLLFTLAVKSTPFTGQPRVDVSDGGPWIPCDRRASVKSGGAQLLQKGSVAGVDIATYFPQDQSRRVRIRNGGGGATEIDLVRTGDGFLIAWTNRTPSKAKRISTEDAGPIDALADAKLTLRPASTAEPAFDAVAVVANPPLPEGANDQFVTLLATNVQSGATTPQNTTYNGDGATSFHHVLLPAGTYRFTSFRAVSFGNPLTFLSNLSQRVDLPGEFTIGRDSRTIQLAIPDDSLPQAVDSTIVVTGVESLSPSVSNRITVGIQLTQVDGPATLFADRAVTNTDPIPFDLQIPPGDYTVTLSAGSQVDGSSRTSTSIDLGRIAIPGTVPLHIPALARLSGSILDPGFRLFADGSYPGDVSQRIFVGSTSGSSPKYSALSSLFGFSRSYRTSLPVGGSVLVSASLAIDVSAGSSSATPFGRLDFQATPAPIPVDGDVDVDVPVPDLPDAVTIEGTVLDRTGKSLANAFVFLQGSNVEGLPGATFSTSARTNRDGTFAVAVLKGRAYRVTVISGFGIEF